MDAREDFAAAFSELYAVALNVGARILPANADAEDVAAEALARAYARWSRVGSMPYRAAWVARVTANLAIDLARRKPPQVPIALVSQDAGETTVVQQMAVTSAIRSLPRRQRQVVVLRFLADFSEVEVARSLNMSSSSVKTHGRRALAALRDYMRQHPEAMSDG